MVSVIGLTGSIGSCFNCRVHNAKTGVPIWWILQGFKNLYTLEKGIQNYMKKKGTDLWEGSLFVFDGRMAIRPGVHLPCNLSLINAREHFMCAEPHCSEQLRSQRFRIQVLWRTRAFVSPMQAVRMGQPLKGCLQPQAVRCAAESRSCRTSIALILTATSSSWLAPHAK